MPGRKYELWLMVEYLRRHLALVRRRLALGGAADAVLEVTARGLAGMSYPTLDTVADGATTGRRSPR